MKSIICPVDFSETAENAAQYAARVAKMIDAEVVLAHAQHVPVVETYTPVVTLNDMMEQKQLEASKKLDSLASKLKSSIGGNIRTWQTFGLVVDMIKEIESETPIFLIVMGTKGATNPIDRWIGTTSTDVMARCELPMIIVPGDASFEGLNKVGYATDFTQETDDGILDFQEFIKPFNADLSIVHVSNKRVNADELLAVVKHFEPKANVDTIAGDNIAEELNDYVWTNDLQLLALKRHKRNVFTNLFHKSVSRELAISSNMPVLIF
jgi:nucleotide-binding universal stress UspA family protein